MTPSTKIFKSKLFHIQNGLSFDIKFSCIQIIFLLNSECFTLSIRYFYVSAKTSLMHKLKRCLVRTFFEKQLLHCLNPKLRLCLPLTVIKSKKSSHFCVHMYPTFYPPLMTCLLQIFVILHFLILLSFSLPISLLTRPNPS